MSTVGTVFRAWLGCTHLLCGPWNWEWGDIEFEREFKAKSTEEEYRIGYDSHVDVFSGSPLIYEKAFQRMSEREEDTKILLWCYFTLSTISAMEMFKDKDDVHSEQKLGAMKVLLVQSFQGKHDYDSVTNVFYYFQDEYRHETESFNEIMGLVEKSHLMKATTYKKFVPRSVAELVARNLDKRDAVLEYKRNIEKWWRAGLLLDLCESKAQFDAIRQLFNQRGVTWGKYEISPLKITSFVCCIARSHFDV